MVPGQEITSRANHSVHMSVCLARCQKEFSRHYLENRDKVLFGGFARRVWQIGMSDRLVMNSGDRVSSKRSITGTGLKRTYDHASLRTLAQSRRQTRKDIVYGASESSGPPAFPQRSLRCRCRRLARALRSSGFKSTGVMGVGFGSSVGTGSPSSIASRR